MPTKTSVGLGKLGKGYRDPAHLYRRKCHNTGGGLGSWSLGCILDAHLGVAAGAKGPRHEPRIVVLLVQGVRDLLMGFPMVDGLSLLHEIAMISSFQLAQVYNLCLFCNRKCNSTNAIFQSSSGSDGGRWRLTVTKKRQTVQCNILSLAKTYPFVISASKTAIYVIV